MRRRIVAGALLFLSVMVFMLQAMAEPTISTTLVMRVSRMAQSAVVDAGEDLSMEISIDGVTPASYQWYFNNEPLQGANQKVYSIVNAKPEDTGVYRMDAYDENGKMLVSMEIFARVRTPEVPKTADSRLPVASVAVASVLSGAALIVLKRKETE